MEFDAVSDAVVPNRQAVDSFSGADPIFKMPAIPPIRKRPGRPKGSLNKWKPSPITSRRPNVEFRRSSRLRCTCDCPIHSNMGPRSTPSILSMPFRGLSPARQLAADPTFWLRNELMQCHCSFCINMRIRFPIPTMNGSVMAYNLNVRYGNTTGGNVSKGKVRARAAGKPAKVDNAGPKNVGGSKEPGKSGQLNKVARTAEGAVGPQMVPNKDQASGLADEKLAQGTRVVDGVQIMDRILRSLLEAPPLASSQTGRKNNPRLYTAPNWNKYAE